MARPIKNNADYFPHDADMRNDPRIKAMRRKFGLDGYAIYSMLLEFITDSDYFEIKKDPLTIELMAGDFDCDPEKLQSVLDYCFTLDLFQMDEKTSIISCKSLYKRLEPLLSKRKRDRTVVIADDNTQSKVKESKEDESEKPLTLGLPNDNFFLVLPKQIGFTKYRVNGTDGLKKLFETVGSSIPLYNDELGYKFVRNNKGKVFNEFSHVYNSWNKFLEKQ